MRAASERLAVLSQSPSILLKIIRNKVTFTAGDWQPAIPSAILRSVKKPDFIREITDATSQFGCTGTEASSDVSSFVGNMVWGNEPSSDRHGNDYRHGHRFGRKSRHPSPDCC